MNTRAYAVIDTPFWSLCCIVGLEPYLWSTWDALLVPALVQQQLFHQIRPVSQQQLFTEALHAGRLHIQDPHTLITTLSKGERAVLSLAQEQHIAALLDDYRPHQHAAGLGITVIGVTQFLIRLLYQGTLSVSETEHHFEQLRQTGATSPLFLQWAAQHIQQKGRRGTWP